MSLVAFPTSSAPESRKRAARLAWLSLPAIALLAAVVYWAATRTWTGRGAGAVIGPVYTVLPMDFEVKVSQKGELQAINNIDIMCLVEGQTTIQTIVSEGSAVKNFAARFRGHSGPAAGIHSRIDCKLCQPEIAWRSGCIRDVKHSALRWSGGFANRRACDQGVAARRRTRQGG